MTSEIDDEASYVWQWFALHANQRMQMVSFWLVATSFLSAAFVQAYVEELALVAFGVALLGASASLTFWRIDVRTRQLIRVSEIALIEIEDDYVSRGRRASASVATAGKNYPNRRRYDSYRVLVWWLQLIFAGVFLVGGVLALRL